MANDSTKTYNILRGLDWSKGFKLHWNGRVAVHELTKDRLVKVEFEESNGGTHISGARVTVINKVTGPVDATDFFFRDHLSTLKKDRTDDRAEGKHEWGSSASQNIHLYGGRGQAFDWYIAVPKTTRPFCEAIEAHIKRFL
jgi:hypothetical protein